MHETSLFRNLLEFKPTAFVALCEAEQKCRTEVEPNPRVVCYFSRIDSLLRKCTYICAALSLFCINEHWWIDANYSLRSSASSYCTRRNFVKCQLSRRNLSRCFPQRLKFREIELISSGDIRASRRQLLPIKLLTLLTHCYLFQSARL